MNKIDFIEFIIVFGLMATFYIFNVPIGSFFVFAGFVIAKLQIIRNRL